MQMKFVRCFVIFSADFVFSGNPQANLERYSTMTNREQCPSLLSMPILSNMLSIELA